MSGGPGGCAEYTCGDWYCGCQVRCGGRTGDVNDGSGGICDVLSVTYATVMAICEMESAAVYKWCYKKRMNRMCFIDSTSFSKPAHEANSRRMARINLSTK